MKLLFDANISHRLVDSLSDLFPGSAHVHLVGLERGTDREVWEMASGVRVTYNHDKSVRQRRPMPQTKLTLRLDSHLIDRAKQIARRQGKSVSRMVADYFRTLDSGERPDVQLPPLTRSLHGILAGSSLREEDYRRHLEKKHG